MSSDYRRPDDAAAFAEALRSLPADDVSRYVATLGERDRLHEDYVNNHLNQEVYQAVRSAGDVDIVNNTETTIVTLGEQLYLGGRTYEIRGTVSLMADTIPTVVAGVITGGTRGLCRIKNVTDTLRVIIFDSRFLLANRFTTYHAIYRFTPAQNVIKEFSITAQNASAVGTFTVCGSAVNADNGMSALITATKVATPANTI